MNDKDPLNLNGHRQDQVDYSAWIVGLSAAAGLIVTGIWLISGAYRYPSDVTKIETLPDGSHKYTMTYTVSTNKRGEPVLISGEGREIPIIYLTGKVDAAFAWPTNK